MSQFLSSEANRYLSCFRPKLKVDRNLNRFLIALLKSSCLFRRRLSILSYTCRELCVTSVLCLHIRHSISKTSLVSEKDHVRFSVVVVIYLLKDCWLAHAKAQDDILLRSWIIWCIFEIHAMVLWMLICIMVFESYPHHGYTWHLPTMVHWRIPSLHYISYGSLIIFSIRFFVVISFTTQLRSLDKFALLPPSTLGTKLLMIPQSF